MTAAVYKHILRIFYNKPLVLLGFVTEIVRTVLIKLVSGLLLAHIIGSLDRGDMTHAVQLLWWLLATSLAGVTIGTAGGLIAVHAEINIYGELGRTFYTKLTNKDMAFYHTQPSGLLTVAFRQYLDIVFQLVRLLRVEIIRTLTSVLGPVVVLFMLDWRLGLATLAVVLIQLMYIRWSSTITNKYREILNVAYQKLTAMVGDHITNIVALRSSGEPRRIANAVYEQITQENKTYWLRAKTPVLLDWPRSLITMGGIAMIVLIELGIHMQPSHLIGLSVLTITYLFQILYSFENLPGLLMLHDNAIVKIHPMLQYWQSDDESIKDPLVARRFPIRKPVIELKNIAFQYAGGSLLFDNFSLRIKRGEHVGIVGHSGSGKSTLAALLLRFYDVQAGSVTINDIDVREFDQADMHRHIAYVPQEPLLLRGTIRDNISFFNSEICMTDIEKAAHIAQAHDFITRLPQGYDTEVGERGIKLSGGQRQRIAIARAVLKNAPIVLFDEATSALDSDSEHLLQRAMPDIIGECTAVIIAHRLSSVAHLDRILVMQHGAIIEEGTHQQLLEAKGAYWAMWQKQSLVTE